MTVEKLMEKLKKMNPKAVVKMHNRDGETLLYVQKKYGDEETVWLESESDIDIYGHIDIKLEDAIQNDRDELDLYMEFLEVGIDVDMVRRYMGDETADHMQEFCEEHGLI